MLGEYKVEQVEGGWEVFWFPQAPTHYQEKIPVDGKVYTAKQAAYARKKKLEGKLKERLALRNPAENVA